MSTDKYKKPLSYITTHNVPMCNAVARPSYGCVEDHGLLRPNVRLRPRTSSRCTLLCTWGSLSVPRRARLLFFEENGKMWEYVVGSGKSCGFLDAYFTGGKPKGDF
jgi:hypothetical protein